MQNPCRTKPCRAVALPVLYRALYHAPAIRGWRGGCISGRLGFNPGLDLSTRHTPPPRKKCLSLRSVRQQVKKVLVHAESNQTPPMKLSTSRPKTSPLRSAIASIRAAWWGKTAALSPPPPAMYLSMRSVRQRVEGGLVHAASNLVGKEFNFKLPGNEVYCTNALLLLLQIML